MSRCTHWFGVPNPGLVRLVLAVVGATIVWLGAAGSALALNLDVDTITDNPALTTCSGGTGGDCSLRGAIIKANTTAGTHTITVPAGTFTLTSVSSTHAGVDVGDLKVFGNITITGAGANATIIAADTTAEIHSRSRVFAVYDTGSLLLRDVTVTGGAPYVSPGGGIYAEGPLTLERVAVRNNSADFYGGGLYILATTIIRNSMISNNTVSGNGGGLAIGAQDGLTSFNATIENTTISTNHADSSSNLGGGVYYNVASSANFLTLNNVTLTENTADNAGGIRNSGGAVVRLSNTIVSNNHDTNAGSGQLPNCFFAGPPANAVSLGYNLEFGADSCNFSTVSNDIVNTADPQLDVLVFGGGLTPSHIPSRTSPVLDKGNQAALGSGGAACAATDQRGVPRILDGDFDGTGRCDIGAVEGGLLWIVDTTTDNGALIVCNAATAGDCSLRGAISNTFGFAASQVIMLPATGAARPYRLTQTGSPEDLNASGDLDIRNDIHIVGGGAQTTIIDGNATDRVFHVTTATANTRLHLYDLTVQNGHASTAGGGVLAERPLTLTRVRVRANTALNGGGGVYFVGVRGLIFDSAITNNGSSNGFFGNGGGINQATTNTVTIRNTTIANNTANGGGGGIYTQGVGTMGLNNVTIADNKAAIGGGIYTEASVSSINTIVANNTLIPGALPGNAKNCGGGGTFSSQGYNLVYGGETCNFFGTGDKQDQNPQLQPLALNGGTTETIALGSLSVAIDAGNPAAPSGSGGTCVATDQRGVGRPIDGDTVGGSRCDIGAYEAALCTTRPRVTTGILPGGTGRLSVTVTAGYGKIVELRLHPGPNDNVLYNVGAGDQSGERVVPVDATSKTFTLKRANGTGSGTLKFDVVDGCNVWQTLAGGGPRAWQVVGPSLDEDPPAAAPRTTPAAPAAAVPPACASDRPKVGVKTVKTASGQYQTTLSTQTSPSVPTNALQRVRIGSVVNASVTLNGSPVTSGQTVTLPEGTQQATLAVSRQPPNQPPGQSMGVSLVVTDACGDWSTFVGSGPGT